MNKQEIYQEVSGLLETLFEVDAEAIQPTSRLYEDLELDSIDAVDMVVHLQKRIGRKIKPETFKTVRTVQDVVDAVDQLIREDASTAD
ncbi:acyl carrier protein [Winslowiella iniecta]|uniref:Acyl carrier protein n=1 Tax=Winslowiella iniecta TaxID=1560201 RepID=A0A0L7TE25_9GAMM|nr:acyl carrier protein [Winslowiella iniecta]KOC90509.1 acyl carrier protein [Winslowiella iniecta]KOC93613.1 acyl carrier protein [Winslowiella iniecta]